MKIFLDSSVLLSASGSDKSLSRLVTILASRRGWRLLSSGYCRSETVRNLAKLGDGAAENWPKIEKKLVYVADALTSERPLLLAAGKDKPVLISALAAECDLLLTLDRGDFGILLNTEVYGMRVETPRDFLLWQGVAQIRT